MNPDLIEQLKQLNPTEGEWEINEKTGHIYVNGHFAFSTHHTPQDDDTLVTLAPTMRLEILAMAKEIEELKEELKEWQSIEDGYKHDNTSLRKTKKP